MNIKSKISPAWIKQFEIVKEKISNEMNSSGLKFTLEAAAKYLGLSKGKFVAWSNGQRPSADDLELLARRFGFSPAWLLTGEGEPENPLEAADGRLAGDLLHDIVLGRIAGNVAEAAERMGMEPEALDACLGLRFAGDWATLRKLAAAGVNVDFLLLGEGQDYIPRAPIRRVMLAIGANNAYALASALDAETKEVERFLAEPDDDPLAIPGAWSEVLEKKYGLCMRWVNDLTYPSHIPVKGMAGEATDPLTRQMEAFERLMRARNAPDEEVREGLLALVRNYRPGSGYPTAEVEQKSSPYGSLGEAAEETAPFGKKKIVG